MPPPTPPRGQRRAIAALLPVTALLLWWLARSRPGLVDALGVLALTMTLVVAWRGRPARPSAGGPSSEPVAGREVAAAQAQAPTPPEEPSQPAPSANRPEPALDAHWRVVAHELRTPLTSLCGFADLLHLQPGMDPMRRMEAIRILHRQAHQLEALLDRLLDRPAAVGNETTAAAPREPIDLAALARSAARDVRDALSPQRVQLVGLAPEGSAAVWCMAEPAALRRAVVNLLGNALKYSSPGSPVELGVALVGLDVGPGWARLTVRDHGDGMDPHDCRRAFEAGWRRAATSQSRPGAGLGLALAREIAERHGGRLRLASRPGVGTRAVLWLPLAPAPWPTSEWSASAPMPLMQPTGAAAGSAARRADTQPGALTAH